ncbi:MAG TPA: RNA methyltransferase [Dehalococcoidia bacterium]|nr:RNA methyltransferase [Dehalococcoidia bacterium]
MLISSRSNERVKAVRSLKDRRERDGTGTFFAEGVRLVQAALDHNAAIEQVVIAPDRLTEPDSALLDALTARNLPLLEVTGEVFDSLSFREETQSVGAVVRQKRETLSLAGETRRCWVALPEIQHPGNLGTVIRNCDAVGGDGVILVGRTTDPYHPIAVRGTLGAIFSQRIVRATEAEFARWLAHCGCMVVGTSPAGDSDYRQLDYASRPVVLLMGSERIGLTPEQLALCDHLVRIPMAGYVESLNLSIAAALVLYEVLRQREPPP